MLAYGDRLDGLRLETLIVKDKSALVVERSTWRLLFDPNAGIEQEVIMQLSVLSPLAQPQHSVVSDSYLGAWRSSRQGVRYNGRP